MLEPLVRARGLQVHFPLFKGFVQRLLGGGRRFVHAVDAITFHVMPGEIFGLVGESGCGKSTTGRALLGLAPVTEGEIVLEFPETEAEENRWVRPIGVLLVVFAWWASAAIYAGHAAALAATGRGFLPSGIHPILPGLALAAWILLAASQAVAAAGLWTMRPWSRRPARLVALLGVFLAIDALPIGLLPFAGNLIVGAYLGSSGVAGLVRRSGWLVPSTRFAIGPRGVLEGSEEEELGSRLRRLLVGPKAVSASGSSWIVRRLRSKVQIVYQDPHAALNPALTLGEGIEHALRAHWGNVVAVERADGNGSVPAQPTSEAVRSHVLALFDDVGLRPPEQFYAKFPSEISGGQKQRVVIARSLAPRPRLLVADEPVALLDMSIRAKILELLLDLKAKYGLTYVFITHDLATAKLVCDRIGIMYLGRIVEMGPAARIFEDPKHPYTQALLQAIPIPDPKRRRPKVLPKGEVPDAVAPPAGCRFHPRCPVAMATCGWEGRDFIDYLEDRRMDAAQAEEDEAALGPIKEWRAAGAIASRAVGEESVERLTTRVRAAIAEAAAPMREAVASVQVEGGRIVVRFREPVRLEPKEVEGRTVECLLY